MLNPITYAELDNSRYEALLREAAEYRLATPNRFAIPDDVRRLAAPVLSLVGLIVASYCSLP